MENLSSWLASVSNVTPGASKITASRRERQEGEVQPFRAMDPNDYLEPHDSSRYATLFAEQAIGFGAQVERPGWEERVYYAEILRLKGWMLSLESDLEGAEKNYLASLDWAREQQAKSWELRTSTSLARLWQSQGKRKEALDLLTPVYEWFTEGFDTKDLKEARGLLDELEALK